MILQPDIKIKNHSFKPASDVKFIMYRSLSGRSMPPSPPPHTPRRAHQSLTIRTASHLPQEAHQQGQNGTSSSPPQPYLTYPLPIPLEKQAKARKLHHKYQLEVTLARSKVEPQAAYLSVPGPPTPHSVTSHASSRRNRGTSISTSFTELSSVVSWDGDESPSSAKTKANGELIAFDGKAVKTPRIRRRLSSVQRAKAALVRHLGSCRVCHSRKVQCPLEHHDLDSLSQLTPQGNRPHEPHNLFPAPSSSATSSQSTDVSLVDQHTSPSFSQNDVLAGIEGNTGLEDLGPIETTLDIQSPGVYGNTQLQIPAPAAINYIAPALPIMSANPYGSYQNGNMVALGSLLNGSYYCQHLGGLCNEYFNTDEELQNHFALAHFEFTRITPAHRFVCSVCQHFNNDLHTTCYQCRIQGMIQLWVFGHYIRTPNYQRYAPDGQDLQGFTAYSAPFSSITFPIIGLDLDFDGNADAGGFGLQDGSLYRGPGNHAYGYNPPSGSDTGGSQFHGSVYGGARQLAMSISSKTQHYFIMSQQFFGNHKIALLLLSLLSIVTIRLYYEWILSQAQLHFRQASSKLQTHLPALGFLAIIGSFTFSLAVRSCTAKHKRELQCRRRCPLHAFTKTPFSSSCRPPAPDICLHHEWSL